MKRLKSEGLFFIFFFSVSLKAEEKLVYCKRMTYKNKIHRGSQWERGKSQIANTFSHSWKRKKQK